MSKAVITVTYEYNRFWVRASNTGKHDIETWRRNAGCAAAKAVQLGMELKNKGYVIVANDEVSKLIPKELMTR